MLLSTCSADSTNGRDILVGRVTDTQYEDTFDLKETNNTGIKAKIDEQAGIGKRIPLWLGISILVLALVILLKIVIFNRKKKRSSFQNGGNGDENEGGQKE